MSRTNGFFSPAWGLKWTSRDEARDSELEKENLTNKGVRDSEQESGSSLGPQTKGIEPMLSGD